MTRESAGKNYVLIVTMCVVKAKSFDVERLAFQEPKLVIDKNYIVPVQYDRGSCIIQFPRCQIYTALFEKNGKYFVEIIVQKHSVVQELYNSLTQRCQDFCATTKVLQSCAMGGNLRRLRAEDGVDCYTLPLKCPQIGNKFSTAVLRRNDNSEEESSFMHLCQGDTVIPVVCMECMYNMNGNGGFNLLLKEIIVVN